MNDSFLSLDAEEVKAVVDVDSAHVITCQLLLCLRAFMATRY